MKAVSYCENHLRPKEQLVQTRRFPRYSLDRPMTAVIYWEDVKVRKVAGRCLVISERGMGARLTDQLYVGDIVRLDMPPLPPVYASVRNSCGTRYGFEFLFTQPGERKAVTGMCETAAAATQE